MNLFYLKIRCCWMVASTPGLNSRLPAAHRDAPADPELWNSDHKIQWGSSFSFSSCHPLSLLSTPLLSLLLTAKTLTNLQPCGCDYADTLFGWLSAGHLPLPFHRITCSSFHSLAPSALPVLHPSTHTHTHCTLVVPTHPSTQFSRERQGTHSSGWRNVMLFIKSAQYYPRLDS